jgi:ferritin-like metal-binding protein YciE
MQIQTLKDLFVFRLNQTYSAEKATQDLFTQLSSDAQHPKVKELLQRHTDTVNTQMRNIEQCLSIAGSQASAVQNHVIKGMIEEVGEFRRQNPSVDAFDAYRLGVIAKLAWMKVANYRVLVAESKALGMNDCTRILENDLRDMESKTNNIIDAVQQIDQSWSGGSGPSLGMR